MAFIEPMHLDKPNITYLPISLLALLYPWKKWWCRMGGTHLGDGLIAADSCLAVHHHVYMVPANLVTSRSTAR